MRDHSGDENYWIYRIKLETGETSCLTDIENAKAELMTRVEGFLEKHIGGSSQLVRNTG